MNNNLPMIGKRPSALLFTALLCLTAVLLLSVLVFRYFLVALTVSASVAILLDPLNRRLITILRGRRSLAALVLVLLTLLVILLPLLGGVAMIGNQAVYLLGQLQPRLTQEALTDFWINTLPTRFPWIADFRTRMNLDNKRIADLLSPVLTHLAAATTRFFQQGVGLLAQAFFQLVLFLFMLFYLLRDGRQLGKTLSDISPLSEEQENEVYEHLSATVKGVWQSMMLVPLAQGVLAMIGFAIFGLPSALFWGTMLIFSSLIPGIGSTLIWLPAGIYLFVTGTKAQGIGLILYGVFVISAIDNVLKPIILRGSARIHPLLGFLAILGGVLTFGFVGFLLGPVILSLLLSTVRIYRLNLLMPRPPEPPPPGP
jgi:predicted PurR-regulated permease PerM